MITIDYLDKHPHLIPLLAKIWYEELGAIWSPDASLSLVEEKLETHLNQEALPLTFVALDGQTPVGMCSLRSTDGILAELSPWLGSLVVTKEYQGRGIAFSLISAVIQKARGMSFVALYLFTFDPTLPNYYSRFGWVEMERGIYLGRPYTAMQLKL